MVESSFPPAIEANFEATASGEHRAERSLVLERDSIEVTPDSLLADNHSDMSIKLTQDWRDNRDSGNLIIEEPCSDARPPEAQPQNITRLPSIAASGSIEPYFNIYTGPQSKAVIIKPHYSKFLFVPGQIPRGCGGNGAKEQMLNGKTVEGDIGAYIATLPHMDPLINALYKAQNIASLIDKPVLATAQDHISGEIKPFAWFQKTSKGTVEFDSAVPLNMLFANNYDPARIYEMGIPELKRGKLPEIFQSRLAEYDAYNEQLHRDYPNFEEEQKVQNPKTIAFSTNIKPLKIRYPKIFGLPGSVFELRFGRERQDGEDSIIESSLHEALNQAHYAISHSVAHHEDDTQDFSKTNRIMIETSDIDLSTDLACELAEKPWMKEWMELPNHRILVAQARGGQTTKAQYLT